MGVPGLGLQAWTGTPSLVGYSDAVLELLVRKPGRIRVQMSWLQYSVGSHYGYDTTFKNNNFIIYRYSLHALSESAAARPPPRLSGCWLY
jgi:hypothetical protein